MSKTKKKGTKKIKISKKTLGISLLLLGIIAFGVMYLLVLNPIKRSGKDVLSISYTGKTVYQYDEVNLKDFKVEEKGKTYSLDKYKAHVTNPVYMGNVVSFNIDDTIYSTKVDYVGTTEPIIWTYDGKTSVPKDLTEDTIDISKIKGKITYTDNTVREISPKSVVLETTETEIILNLSDGLVTYRWDAAIEE